MKRFLWYVLIAVTVAFGVALRLVETANGNYVFGFDQGADFLAAQSIAFGRKLTLIGAEAGAGFAGLPGIFHGPGYRYLLSGILFVSSGNPYGAIVFLAVLSLIVLWCIYRLSVEIFGKPTGLLVLVLSAVSLPLSAQARMVWAPNFSGIIVVPFLYSLWAIRKPTALRMFTTAILASGLYHFEIPMALPAIVAAMAYAWLVLKIRHAPLWAAFGTGILAGFLPMIVFESRHGWGIIRGLMFYAGNVSVGSSAIPFHPVGELIGDGNALFTTIRESFVFGVAWVRMVFPWVLLSGAVYYARTEKQKDIRQYVTALLLLVGAHMAVYYPYRGPVYSHYFSLLYAVYPILAGFVAVRAMKRTATGGVAVVLGALLAAGVFMTFPKTIATDYADFGGTAKIRGKIEALDTVYKDAASEKFGLFIFTPPVYTYAYDYLTGWHGRNTYGYVPSTQKLPVYYLLIEPDPEKPWSYNGWIETVIKPGRLVRSWNLASGFIIEKRIGE